MLRTPDEPRERTVNIPLPDGRALVGDVGMADAAVGTVVFAHGGGSSRTSPRNRNVAGSLREHRLHTVLFDLLTPEEQEIDETTRHLRFDVELLAGRLIATTGWLRQQTSTEALPIGYFGASTGAAAALIAAAQRPDGIGAVVSRGGRADLAGTHLAHVRAPTLLIVGSNDSVVVDLNRQALAELRVEATLEIVPGATHLFSEPGAIETVADLAGNWFESHLATAMTGSP